LFTQVFIQPQKRKRNQAWLKGRSNPNYCLCSHDQQENRINLMRNSKLNQKEIELHCIFLRWITNNLKNMHHSIQAEIPEYISWVDSENIEELFFES